MGGLAIGCDPAHPATTRVHARDQNLERVMVGRFGALRGKLPWALIMRILSFPFMKKWICISARYGVTEKMVPSMPIIRASRPNLKVVISISPAAERVSVEGTFTFRNGYPAT
jgi:hypothetical protein